MKFSKRIVSTVPALVAGLILSFPAPAQETDSAIAACLKAWGKHPFGSKPQYKTLQTSVKVFGIGKGTSDSEATSSPALILVNPGVNVMGGLNIRAHCRAHLASSSEGATVMGSNTENKGTTVMGSTRVERVNCN